MDWNQIFAMVLVAAILPFFWTVAIAVPLWICRKFMSDRLGLRLFGHYWKPPREHRAEQSSPDAPRRWIR